MSVDNNAVVAGLLSGLGLAVEPEPAWVGGGEVPDFFCTGGTTDLWVEVKSISEAEWSQQFAMKGGWLRQRAKTVAKTGSAFAWIGETATERDAKAAIALTRHALGVWEAMAAPPDRVYVIVPCDPDYSKRVIIAVNTARSSELLFCVASRSDRYGRPHGDEEITWRSVATIEGDGGARSEDPSRLGLYEDDFAVGLALSRSESPFKVHGIAPTGPARMVTTTQTVRAAAKKANSQFKSACNVRPAPCLLIVLQSGLFVQEPLEFASVFYGDLQYSFSRTRLKDGPLSFGRNGIWTPDTNRTTSGAALIPEDGQPILVRKPVCHHPHSRQHVPMAGRPNGRKW